MKKIAVLFGGRSVEHDVSVITGMQVIENMDKEKFIPVPVYITREGKWLSGESLGNFATFKKNDFSQAKEVFFKMDPKDPNLYTIEEERGGLFSKKSAGLKVYEKIDAIFPALHGTYGEDGTMQGFLDLMDIPYVGCNTLSAAVGMDKVIMKEIFRDYGLPVLDFRTFYRNSWKENQEGILAGAEELGYPLFVKPANLGSSIGISRVTNREELVEAIVLALHYDRKILVEKAANEPREINAAVLGYENSLAVSACEEPLGWKELLTFEDKYMSGGKGSKGGKQTSNLRNVPAPLDEELQEKIEKYAMGAFRAIDACGTARIDFLVDDSGVYVNEINTLPGSIGFYLWEPKGIPMKELITRLLDLAEERQKDKRANTYTFDSHLFEKTGYGSKL